MLAYGLVNLFGIRFNHLISNITGKDFDSLLLLKKYGDKRGFDLPVEQWQEINWLWYLPLRQKTTLEADIAGTLEKLKGMGLKLGIISNTFVNGHALDRHLEEEGLLDFFPIRLYSYQFDFRKPDKRIFLEGARQIQVDPQNIMYIGDRIDKDVKGSVRAGMIPVLKKAYTNDGKKAPEGTHKIETLAQLPALIEKINNQQQPTDTEQTSTCIQC
jgi:HAD superfamily hydrolase (TIGR01549 family)